jgi:predicted dehydrogenase
MTYPLRLAIVGGHRGGAFRQTLAVLAEHVALTAVCDLNPAVLAAWQEIQSDLRTFGDYTHLLEADVCDAVLLATPMDLHAQQAIQALEAGKHVLSEVIAATSLEDCWQLVEAVERAERVYMLAENYCYTRPTMLVRTMVERGVFGTVSYAEGAYIHDCRPLMFDGQDQLTWRGYLGRQSPRNVYPTHSLGPVAQWLGCTGPRATDRLTEVLCWTTPDRARRLYVEEYVGATHPAAAPGFFTAGDSASTLIRTVGDAVAYLRVDVSSPRPHNTTHYVLQGTQAAYLSARYPEDEPLVWIKDRGPDQRIGEEAWQSLWAYAPEYEHPRWQAEGAVARTAGHGGGDYFVIEDFLRAVRGEQPVPIDVYDAVTWSSIYALSAASVQAGGHPQAIPSFRRRPPGAVTPT